MARTAARFATEELIPWEVEAELNEGRLPPEVKSRHKRLAIELGFSAMDVPAEHGGRDARVVEQVAVWEELGRVTNALCWCFSEPHRWMFEACTEEQLAALCAAAHERQAQGMLRDHRERRGFRRRDRGHRPALPGRLPDFGREVVRHEREPRRLLHPSGPARRRAHAGSHALFFIDDDQPGIELVRTPPFSHTFSDHHPIYRFNDVLVPERSGSAPRATACSTLTAGSAANG